MRHAFYDSDVYRKTQSSITKRNQERGVYEHLKKSVVRVCVRSECTASFSVQPGNPKRYCSSSCAARVNNTHRAPPTKATKEKIGAALRGRPTFFKNATPRKGTILVPREERVCINPRCGKAFFIERWRRARYCTSLCAIRSIGRRPTSPKASRGKAGIRPDVSDSIYFYSRWEANVARLYTYLGTIWKYAPKTFDIGGHTYTPDFYLPISDTYIEVKNFLEHIQTNEIRHLGESIPGFDSMYCSRMNTWNLKGNMLVEFPSGNIRTASLRRPVAKSLSSALD